jgi:hypothetical protein
MADDDERLRPWLWPGGWFRDEAFWRQVTTATASTLMTAGVAFLAARFAGIFAQVPWSTICKTLIAGTVLVLVLAVVVLLLETGVATRREAVSLQAAVWGYGVHWTVGRAGGEFPRATVFSGKET